MARYLLGTQVLVDLARRDAANPVHAWALREDIGAGSVFVSVMSFGLFKTAVEEQKGAQREVWRELFDEALWKFGTRQAVLPVTLEVALQSAALNPLSLHTSDPESGEPVPLDESNQLVAATALIEGLTLVDRRQPYHEDLEKLGLSLFDPYS